jgi:menaquinone-dependent protoporphyrinogen IX oxidase
LRNCLVVCATKQQTACQVAGQIANALRLRGVAVDLQCSCDLDTIDGYDAVVIGARLCHGRWRRSTKRFLKQHREVLQETDVALFAPGPCAGGQQMYDRSWDRLIKMLHRLGWLDPVRIEVFSDGDLPAEAAGCPGGERSRIAHWCRGLAVAMHPSDQEAPRQPGIT